jgi:phosphoglycerate-specific signal transduction histidine kinase
VSEWPWNDILRTLAALIAAFAALIGVWKYRSEVNSARRLKWQKTAIQEIMQTVDDTISFADLKVRYRSLAADQMKSLLKTGDISDQSLRMILVELCRDNVIVQLGKEQYSLTTYPGQIEKTQKQNAELLTLQRTFFEAQLELLSKQDTHVAEMLKELRRMNPDGTVFQSSGVIRLGQKGTSN